MTRNREETDPRAEASPDGSAGACPEPSRSGPPTVPGASHLGTYGAPTWAVLVATFFGIGRIRPGPGTWASATTTLLWAVIAHLLPSNWRFLTLASLAALAIFVGIPAATRLSRATGLKDPHFVVIDEVAGQFIAFLGVPLSWNSLLTGFILFRVFDIVKPPPVRRLERIPDGAGIVLDDIGAGIYALLIMHLLLHLGILIK